MLKRNLPNSRYTNNTAPNKSDPHRRRMQWLGFAGFNLAILLGAALLPLYRYLADGALRQYIYCFQNRYLHIYCPTCGITRMLDSLLHLDIIGAARANICLLALVFLVAYFDLRALVSLLRREERILHVRAVYVYTFIGVLIAFGILRNILLIRFGIDPLGDNLTFWHSA